MNNITKIIDYLKAIYELEIECYIWEGLIKAESSKSWPEVPMPIMGALLADKECPKKKSWISHVIFSILTALFLAVGISLVLLLYCSYL